MANFPRLFRTSQALNSTPTPGNGIPCEAKILVRLGRRAPPARPGPPARSLRGSPRVASSSAPAFDRRRSGFLLRAVVAIGQSLTPRYDPARIFQPGRFFRLAGTLHEGRSTEIGMESSRVGLSHLRDVVVPDYCAAGG